MNNIEDLRKIQNIRDKMIYIYDECRFNSKNIRYESFKKVKDMKTDLDHIADSYIEDMPNVGKIVVMEDLIIEPGKTCELITNYTFIGGNNNDVEINLEGYIPTSGYLQLFSKFTDIGLRIYVSNNVPKKEVSDVCGYHYCYPESTRFFDAGVYRIEKGTVIGIIITDEKEINYQYINRRVK